MYDSDADIDALAQESNSRCPFRMQAFCQVIPSNITPQTNANVRHALRTEVQGGAAVCRVRARLMRVIKHVSEVSGRYVQLNGQTGRAAASTPRLSPLIDRDK
jgi:hypothetical protein